MKKTLLILLGINFAALACSPYDRDSKVGEQITEKCIEKGEEPKAVCYSYDYDRADLKLNRIYKELKSKMLPAEFTKVKLDQRKWLKKREKDCECNDSSHDCVSGTYNMSCQAEATWKRAMYLQSLIPY